METHHPGRAHENMRPPRTVLAILDRSSQRLRNIAANLEGGRAGWTDQGLEYSLFSSGQRSLGGFAENSWVTFTVEVRPPGFYDEGVLTWEVEAEIAVRCDHPRLIAGCVALSSVRRQTSKIPCGRSPHSMSSRAGW